VGEVVHEESIAIGGKGKMNEAEREVKSEDVFEIISEAKEGAEKVVVSC
jgi:hypothetical protein